MIASQARSHFYAIGGGKPRRLTSASTRQLEPVLAPDGSQMRADDGCLLFYGVFPCKDGGAHLYMEASPAWVRSNTQGQTV